MGKSTFKAGTPGRFVMFCGWVYQLKTGLSLDVTIKHLLFLFPWMPEHCLNDLGIRLTAEIWKDRLTLNEGRRRDVYDHSSHKEQRVLVEEILYQDREVGYDELVERMAAQPDVPFPHYLYAVRLWKRSSLRGQYLCHFGVSRNLPDYFNKLKMENSRLSEPLYIDQDPWCRPIASNYVEAYGLRDLVWQALRERVGLPKFGKKTIFDVSWDDGLACVNQVLAEHNIKLSPGWRSTRNSTQSLRENS